MDVLMITPSDSDGMVIPGQRSFGHDYEAQTRVASG